eukprot:COSAG03_NODE_3583_length_1937_cov_1.585963_2_plen_68_part_01
MSKELEAIIRKNKSSLRKIFHAFDEDGDGSISASELRLGLRALNLDVSAGAYLLPPSPPPPPPPPPPP